MSRCPRLHGVIELAFVMLFTAAGIGAALLALRLAEGSALIRGLACAFCLLALGNLALYVWRVVARDPAGTAQAAGLATLLVVFAFAYRLFLRALRRRVGRNDAGQNDAGRNRP